MNKFEADKSQLASVKEALNSLKKSDVDISWYKAIIMNVFSNSNTHLTNESFYVEIDEYLRPLVTTDNMKYANDEMI